jgi:hypothetical protein
MIQLPHCFQAYIPSENLSAYLLSETHAVEKAKATFFRALGFHPTFRTEALMLVNIHL